MHTNGERSPTLFLTLLGRGWPRSTHRNHPLPTRSPYVHARLHSGQPFLRRLFMSYAYIKRDVRGRSWGGEIGDMVFGRFPVNRVGDFSQGNKVDKVNRRGWKLRAGFLVDPWEKIERCKVDVIDSYYVIASGDWKYFVLGENRCKEFLS